MMMVPGQELRTFAVKRPDKRETELGRVVSGGFEDLGEIKAILAAAKPEEREQWRQLSHPITHKIIMQGKPSYEVLPGYVFEYDKRRFYNQGMPYNVGDLGHWTIFYCDERTDIN
jgi:hypothetical protein